MKEGRQQPTDDSPINRVVDLFVEAVFSLLAAFAFGMVAAALVFGAHGIVRGGEAVAGKAPLLTKANANEIDVWRDTGVKYPDEKTMPMMFMPGLELLRQDSSPDLMQQFKKSDKGTILHRWVPASEKQPPRISFVVPKPTASTTAKQNQSTDLSRGDKFTGTIESTKAVSDGDTFTITLTGGNVSHRVRLFAVDAPEMAHSLFGRSWKEQPYAKESRDTLASLLVGNKIACTVVSKSFDRYVCTVQVGTKDVCEEMVKAGAAFVEPHFNKSQALRDAEAKARADKRGLWQLSPSPVPPWEWRKGTTKAK